MTMILPTEIRNGFGFALGERNKQDGRQKLA
jgi:hypothetical protein